MMQYLHFKSGANCRPLFTVALALAGGLTGCAGPGAQVSQCQKEKTELLSQIEAERTKSQNLADRSAALEARLDQSEKQVAMLSGGSTRWADNAPSSKDGGTKLGSTTNPRSTPSSSSLASSSDLKWRNSKSPVASKSGASGGEGLVLGSPAKDAAQQLASSTGQLEQMARRDRRLQYDPSTGLAKFQAKVNFSGPDTALTEEARSSLDELARYLKTTDKDNLRIMVVGKPAAGDGASPKGNVKSRGLGLARAQAVADYLDRHGISGDRLAVTGLAAPSSAAAKGTLGSASGPVEIYLAEPTTNIAGWDDVGRQRR